MKKSPEKGIQEETQNNKLMRNEILWQKSVVTTSNAHRKKMLTHYFLFEITLLPSAIVDLN